MPSEPIPTTNSALADEVEAINAIYGAETLSITSSDESGSHAILQLPERPLSFMVSFAAQYPHSAAPQIKGTQSTTSARSKGEGTAAAQVLRDVIARVWAPGQVCLFDVIEEADELLLRGGHHHDPGETEGGSLADDGDGDDDDDDDDEKRWADGPATAPGEGDDGERASPTAAGAAVPPPTWTVSELVTEKKSVFVARCATACRKDEAAASLSHLLATNKKVAGATHNITAWRIRNSETGVTVQDCDDDGETAAGGRLLHLMQLMDVWNVVVVVTRWYGGTKLGPDRFRIINSVARDALVKGGFVVGEAEKAQHKASGRKKKGTR